ncbi:AAA family ATPase [Sedimentibacter sp. zth1]|uniref:AAA family ATPase n=1 Tax=Sedimentibacter sp. zth1 TaxID=2816908 RepID=UPI001A91F688|nr:SbcC/MukB-like Walker B domain-containing protein [Sedimentibacter sp. zth1]QSX06499.1 AAA family ATPase [Sedimentibacter sp. zth1]
MKPIKLKIKGLNSFMDEQVIDFNKLAERGLFGIFGPTGSGKSTVLDGITLALYGEVARKSSNFINTNMGNCNVSYEFSISSTTCKKYLVEREFKIDKKTKNPRSGKCKVMDITNAEPVVLADKVTDVTAECIKIIGLNLEDFTRTVVLPQGKFSEFLKLEGKSRRDMLERLFNLQQYGDNLSSKLSREIISKKAENTFLNGKLFGFEHINEENLEKLKADSLNTKNEYNETLQKSELVNKKFQDNQQLWNLQTELNKYNIEKNNMLEQKEEIENNTSKVKLAQAALRVVPYIHAYKKTTDGIKRVTEQLDDAKIVLFKTKSDKIEAENRHNIVKEFREINVPLLNTKKDKALDAINLYKELDNTKLEINKLNKEQEVLLDEMSINYNDLTTVKQQIKQIDKKIDGLENKTESLKINNEFKLDIINGLNLSKDFKKSKNDFQDKTSRLDKIIGVIDESTKKLLQLKKELDKLNLIINEKQKSLNELEKANPCSQNSLLDLQKQITIKQDLFNKYDTYNKDLSRYSEEFAKYNTDLEKCKLTSENIENNISIIKNYIKDAEVEILAIKLRNDLNKTGVCPVCGSIEHHLENVKHIDVSNIEELNQKLKNLENEKLAILRNMTAYTTRIEDLVENIEYTKKLIKDLGEDFKSVTVDDLKAKFNTVNESLDRSNALKEELIELNNKKISVDSNVKNILENIQKYILDKELLAKELQILNKSLEKLSNNYNNVASKTNVQDFQMKYEEINEIEKQREELLSIIKTDREKSNVLNQKQKLLENKLNILEQNKVKIIATLQQKNNYIDKTKQTIIEKVGDIDDIKVYYKALETEIEKINKKFNAAEIYLNSCQQKYDLANETYIRISTNLNELNISKDHDKTSMQEALLEEGFNTIEDVKKCYLERPAVNEFVEIIEKYKNNLAKIEGSIESICLKINDKHIDEAQWMEIQSLKIETDNKLKEINETRINLDRKLKEFEKKLVEINDLLKQKEKLSHHLALLSDLEKLFKGKRFVEYVASTRLKYISIEADKKLKEISSGNYGLEVDKNGKFIIRDYKNGGVTRDASTLSGGETFIASLALALALSAEIQLKGTAPLELFFLDEGFGTLDDELLEVVMSSIEKIHNDRLKVGIISHVESIKNRVPIKLILTPAESGRGGSKVKLERS